ncbi:MAG: hypothetical protein AB7P22_06780 [Vicinamibacterales bacterium]
MRPQSAPAEPPTAAPFSLFHGDLLNRRFGAIGIGPRRARHIALRAGLLAAGTYLPMAVAAAVQGLFSTRLEARNFFADYAAYAQFLIAVPLFIVAERIVSLNTRDAARDFIVSGVVGPEQLSQVDAVHHTVRRLRLSRAVETALILVAYLLSFFTIGPELIGVGPPRTWHTAGASESIRTFGGLTMAGAWLMLVALPVLNYIWLRLAWKIVIWTYYLYRMSRFRLHLVASHPDLTGGIGFVSEVQAKWALVIFAYGISNVAAVIAYKVNIEGASLRLMPVWAPAVLFVILAPSLFLLPLLMFTRQLFRTKRRAVAAYRAHARRHAIEVESRWIGSTETPRLSDLADLSSVSATLTRTQQMRVVPFDLRSFGQLLGSTLGSIATALPLLRLEGTLEDWLSFLARMLGR